MDKKLLISDLVKIGIDLERLITFEDNYLVPDTRDYLSKLYCEDYENRGSTRIVTGIWDLPDGFSDSVELAIRNYEEGATDIYGDDVRISLYVERGSVGGKNQIKGHEKRSEVTKSFRNGFPYIATQYSIPVSEVATHLLSLTYKDMGYLLVPKLEEKEEDKLYKDMKDRIDAYIESTKKEDVVQERKKNNKKVRIGSVVQLITGGPDMLVNSLRSIYPECAKRLIDKEILEKGDYDDDKYHYVESEIVWFSDSGKLNKEWVSNALLTVMKY